MPPLTSSLSQRALPNVCLTPKCVNLAESILSSVNLNVDPCSDFFQYTCGNWLLSDEIKDRVQGSSTFSITTKKGSAVVLEMLEGTFEDLYDTIKSVDTTYHTQDKMDIDRKNFQLVKTYFDTCIDDELNIQLGSTPLFPFLAQIENVLFPMTKNIEPERLSETIAELTLHGVSSIVHVLTEINFYDHSHNILYVFSGLTEDSVDYEDIDQLESYRNEIIELLTATVGDVSELDNDYGEFVLQESRKNNFTLWSVPKIEIAASDFINFEMKLKKITAINGTGVNPVLDRPSTLKELQSSNPTIDWNMLISTLISSDYPAPNLPIMFQKGYIKALEELLTTTSVKKLQEYFVIKTIQYTVNKLSFPKSIDFNWIASSSKSASLIDDIFKAPTGKEPKPESKSQKCALDTNMKFYDIIGRFFSLKTLGATKELMKVEDMVKIIHSTWLHDMLPQIDWADDETKAGIIEKIEKLITKVAIRQKSPDWRDPSSIDLIYDNAAIDKNNGYFYNAALIDFQRNSKKFKSLSQRKFRSDYLPTDLTPYVANAFYHSLTNSLEILIGILQKPFYSIDYPEYLNYGSLGYVIGHELVHSLDNNGKNYNATGYLEDWFSEHSTKIYDEKAQCFVEQYENFTLTGLNNTQYPLDGNIQLGENIADGGGLNIAFRAYQNHVLKQGPDQLLPGLEHLTPEQMFYVSRGRSSCEITTLSDAEETAKEEVHSPSYYRLIGSLQNDPNFAKTFNCPVGSPMNPAKKCSIW